MLLEHGGDVNIRDQQQKTPFDCACEKGRTQVVQVLISSCSSQLISNPQDYYCTTPLHRAAHHGHVEVVKCLLDSGIVDINRRTASGTALHEAVLSNKPNVVKMLIHRGVDMEATNSFGQTAAQLVEQLHKSNNLYKSVRCLFTGDDPPDVLPSRPYVTFGNDSEFPPPPVTTAKDADRDSGISPQHTPNRLSSHSLSSAESGVSMHSSSSSSLRSLSEIEPATFIHDRLKEGLKPTDPQLLTAWLHQMQLQEYSPIFLSSGYDLPTVSRMTPSDVNALGIQKSDHLKRLKSEISRLHFPDLLPNFIPDSISTFLGCLNLIEYDALLKSQGYNSVDSLTEITFEDLEEVGITKLGHQKKLLLAVQKLRRLKQNNKSKDEILQSPDVVAIQVSPTAEKSLPIQVDSEEVAYSGTLARRNKGTFSRSSNVQVRRNKTPPPPPRRTNSMRTSIRLKPVNPPKLPSVDDMEYKKKKEVHFSSLPRPSHKSTLPPKTLPTPSLQAHSVAVTHHEDVVASNEYLHFANENVGTIRQKSHMEKPSAEQAFECPNILNELDDMLQGLSDELDATISKLEIE